MANPTVKPGNQPRGPKLESLQACRGIAAVAVVFEHTVLNSINFGQSPPRWLNPALYGWLGVDFFFVLSGFIILHVHGNDKAEDWKYYLKKRCRRIYLPYLPIGLGMAAIYIFFPHLTAAPHGWSLFTSGTLLPGGKPALSPAWTLVHEMLFYLVFLVAFYSRSWWFFIVWMIVSIVPWGINRGPLEPITNSINVEFAFGLVAAAMLQRFKLWLGALAIGSLGLLTWVTFAARGFSPPRELFGLASAFIVLGLASVEQTNSLKTPRWLVSLGEASYSIYLVHMPIVSIMDRISSSWIICVPLSVIGSLVAAYAYHFFWEKRVAIGGRGRLKLAPIHG